MIALVRTQEEARRRVLDRGWRPRNCVWELTLACNLRCAHCGSVAGRVRQHELGTEECLRVVGELADAGCELVTLSGGEPTLRRDWDTIARAIADRGIYVNMVTNGVTRDDDAARSIARRALDAGMCNVGVSVDGPPAVHDRIRGEGTFARTERTIRTFVEEGLRVAVLTTVNRLNLPQLGVVRQIAIDAGATQWRVQLGKPMGSMAEHEDWVLAPEDLLTLVPTLARLARQRGIHLHVGDSIGYYGPHDKVLRGTGWRGRKECWKGCQAGMQAIGIEADGSVKGCLSLQARWDGRDPFVEGNLRESSLDSIWNRPGAFAYNREFRRDSLTGACAACRYGDLCRGGARCVSAAVAKSVTEDPYCWTRVEGELPVAGAGRWVTAAGSALAVVVGLSGCPDEPAGASDAAMSQDVSTPDGIAAADVAQDAGPDATVQPEYGVSPDVGQPVEDTWVQPEYGVTPDVVGDVEQDVWVQPEYGVTPDVVGDVEQDVWVQPEYGVSPDVIVSDVADPDAGADGTVQPEYGITPDVIGDAGMDAIDCDAVCCECEYGVLPDGVWDACCAPDPCANVCCDCDYGEPPPPECCD